MYHFNLAEIKYPDSGCRTETHHPLQEELQLLLPLVALLRLLQLLLHDLQTNGSFKPATFSGPAGPGSPHLLLPVLDVVDELVRLLEDLSSVVPGQVVEARISQRLQKQRG